MADFCLVPNNATKRTISLCFYPYHYLSFDDDPYRFIFLAIASVPLLALEIFCVLLVCSPVQMMVGERLIYVYEHITGNAVLDESGIGLNKSLWKQLFYFQRR
jgi:hypothetical protein